MSFKRNSYQPNRTNIPEVEFIRPDKKQSAVIRRMAEIVLGIKTLSPRTRSERLVYYMVLATTATAWWYWLRQVDRYRIETMTEQGMFEFDEKGKLVITDEYRRAANDPYLVTTVSCLQLQKKVDKLEKDISAFKEEREHILEVLENQRRIEATLKSLECNLSK